MAALQDAFISYGRADSKGFAIRLNQRLTEAGLTVWLDLEDIPLATDFLERIGDGIEKAHAIIYIISPSSVHSAYCQQELALALKYNKRIIPLMQVEVIDRTTWRQRYPEGTEQDWQAFQAAGKHQSAIHLSDFISRINWIMFREGVDDFEQSVQALLAILLQHQDYVHQHTELLTKALFWENHHRQPRYLLVGNDRHQAEVWLKTSFPDEPLPCLPTDLHCEFIAESAKNANNLMTQVFLCHSKQDLDTAKQIRRYLLRNSVIVWNYQTDISISQDYNDTVIWGIEAADNIVFLLSPDSVQSNFCQQELACALGLNKRIIPILTSPTPPEQIPSSLQNLQYGDLTDNQEETDFCADINQLLKLLNTDAAYYREHKTWLVQALKWDRQQHNPAMLLRGYNLRRAENWLKVAYTHLHPPTDWHETFIAESLRQPADLSLDVFISYSRADSDFARRLNDALQTQGKRTWFDQESIASGENFQQKIQRGIEACDNFLWIFRDCRGATRYSVQVSLNLS